ncbi:PaaI family thioesterase [Atopomonas sediminilitoris]|uniref:PaaI family thioesterase n=1 Tax=Atopomonas sediminilitoris TaxID=2919919 RepID=UPI001F4DF280|nr:PaaI family thioesterase [Atopomonas sediminilitoris]MCJ8169277.1 PaaI family thioesterase [Atopomonas sediminilitoris]
MTQLTASMVEQVIRQGVPMAEDIDLKVERIDAHFARARVPFQAKMVRPGGTLSGPVIMSLADAAMYAVVLGALGKVEMAVTSHLNINFLARPKPEDLIADARIIKLGRRQAVCEVVLFSSSDEDNPVAHVTGAYALPM